jgi:hypothetical protein
VTKQPTKWYLEMLYYLFQEMHETLNWPGTTGFKYTSFRASAAAVLSLLITIVWGRIDSLFQERRVHDAERALHLGGQQEKANKPTKRMFQPNIQADYYAKQYPELFELLMKYHFLPDLETLAAMVDAFKGNLQNSYRKLLTTITMYKETGHQQSQTILEKMIVLPKKNFSSILTFYYHHTVRAISDGKYIPKLLSDLDTVGNSITNYNISLRGLPKTEEITVKQRLEQGVKYLGHGCPEMLGNVQELVHQIFFVGSDCPEKNCAFSLTNAVTQGIVFINGECNPSWVFLLDKYAHEAAHTYLFLIKKNYLY